VSDTEATSPDEPESASEAEAPGETVGEALWAAVRELERRIPGLDNSPRASAPCSGSGSDLPA
jgi:hypothetical protein